MFEGPFFACGTKMEYDDLRSPDCECIGNGNSELQSSVVGYVIKYHTFVLFIHVIRVGWILLTMYSM